MKFRKAVETVLSGRKVERLFAGNTGVRIHVVSESDGELAMWEFDNVSLGYRARTVTVSDVLSTDWVIAE